ncbi:UDP-N-acetylmuramoyl-tripeptide--D-alanyl-D-alanine ligase, partial [candidate division WWE3 bacterium CG08_land_8_20_14_0_20_41_10]
MDRQIKVCTDNRLIKPGDYFVAIKGENFDGHNFIDSALQKGAKGVLEEKELYELAKDKINRVKPVIIGVTGSSGKTTVTNFLVQILSTKYSVCLGSLNTKLGL